MKIDYIIETLITSVLLFLVKWQDFQFVSVFKLFFEWTNWFRKTKCKKKFDL